MRQFAPSLVRSLASAVALALTATLFAFAAPHPAGAQSSQSARKTEKGKSTKAASQAKKSPVKAAKSTVKGVTKTVSKSAAKPAAKAPAKSQAKPPATRVVESKAPSAKAAKPAVKVADVPPSDPSPIVANSATAYTVLRATTLQRAPDGAAGATAPRAQIQPGTQVDVIARERGWVRVRTEGWVRESDLAPADTSIRTSVSAADVRSTPDRYRGTVVQWTVEYLALQTADTLRQGLAEGEPYLLVRGAGPENSLLYMAIPPNLLGTARALVPLSKMTVVARVRNGRSAPAGVPILDVQSIQPIK